MLTVAKWLDDAKNHRLPDTNHDIGQLRIAFTHSFYHLLTSKSLIDGLKIIISKGGDTDTNACIVGGLIGPLNKVQDID